MGRPRKAPREKDLTSRFLSGGMDEDRVETQQRFSSRNKNAQQEKTLRTFLMRAEAAGAAGDVEALPVGEVLQVYSLFCDVGHGGRTYLCVVRKTLTKVSDTSLVVGDRVRFRVIEMLGGETAADGTHQATAGQTREPEAVVEQVLPRETVLTRTDSFKGVVQHPIVANARQMLIVASLRHPTVKWGLIDRMIVAARGGGLKPVVCLNKIDLATQQAGGDAEDLVFARQVLAHYRTLDIDAFEASAAGGVGLEELRSLLRDRTTVLAGHSGVGKSSLVRAIQPHLDLRVGEISRYTDKGRHTTTSARRYPLDFGGFVVDTPGVKHFGLWGVTRDNLADHFPDVAAGAAPPWRRESYERILASLPDGDA